MNFALVSAMTSWLVVVLIQNLVITWLELCSASRAAVVLMVLVDTLLCDFVSVIDALMCLHVINTKTGPK